nr:ABC transporter substrate-binding protein [Microbacterium ulmi]
MPRYQGQPDLVVGALIFDTLVGYGPDLEIVPELAESWEQPEPTVFEFTLRDDVVFHDGEPLTAEGVVAQFEHAMTLEPLTSWTAPIDSVTADGDVVTFTLKYTTPSFLSNLANGPFAIQSPSSLDMDPADLATTPTGTGPYKLESWQGDVITLVRNDDYWGAAPTQSEIVITTVSDTTTRFNALQAGEYDIIQNVAPYDFTQLDGNPELVGLAKPYAQTVWLMVNHKHPLLADHRIREAVAYALDVDAIVDSATEGLMRPATGFIPPELGPSDAEPRTRDLERAKELLAEAGYPDGITLPLYNTVGRYIGDQDIAQIVQAQLAEAGITVEATVYEYAGLLEAFKQTDTTGLAVIGWSQRATPDAMLNATLRSTGGYNWSAYSNPELDELLGEAEVQATVEDAQPLWAKADGLLVDDVAGVPLYWSQSLFAASSSIEGFSVDPLGYLQLLEATRR